MEGKSPQENHCVYVVGVEKQSPYLGTSSKTQKIGSQLIHTLQERRKICFSFFWSVPLRNSSGKMLEIGLVKGTLGMTPLWATVSKYGSRRLKAFQAVPYLVL